MSALSWRKTVVYALVLVPALGLGGIAVIAAQQATSSQQGSDPVADAARKAREQKKTEASAATPATETKDSSAASTSGDNAGTTKAAAPNKNDEASWRKRFSETRGQLAQTEKELDILQREAQKAQVQFYSDPAKAMKEQYSRTEVTEKDTKIAAKKQEIDQLKQKLSDMEDDLRRSGGEIGWARE